MCQSELSPLGLQHLYQVSLAEQTELSLFFNQATSLLKPQKGVILEAENFFRGWSSPFQRTYLVFALQLFSNLVNTEANSAYLNKKRNEKKWQTWACQKQHPANRPTFNLVPLTEIQADLKN